MSTATILLATVHLSSAELLALHTTAKTIVAAPGAGKVILPLWIAANYTFGSIDYTLGGNQDAPRLVYAGANLTANFNTTLDGTSIFGNIDSVGESTDSLYAGLTFGHFVNGLDQNNVAVVYAQDSGSTVINGNGTLVISLWYVVQEIA
jgi:hypothetical protein